MKKNNMKSIGILTGLWLLLFLNCGQRMAAQIRNKVCDTIPYEFIQEKIIIPVTVNGIKVKSVSYTHLRAHETDSYLVCRLLLEKKKNTMPP